MSEILHDVRYALRQMARAPGFTVVVLLTLALGVSANATVFSAVNALLLRPLPWSGGERLVSLSGAYVDRGNDWSVSWPNAADWDAAATSFENMAWYQSATVTVADETTSERLNGIRSSADLLPMLGAEPALGRLFNAEEASPGGERVVVLSHSLWQSRFGGAPDVVGRTVELSGVTHSIVGVLRESFNFPSRVSQLYLPLRSDATTWSRANGGLQVVARLRETANIVQAQQEMAVISERLAREHPGANAGLSAYVQPLRDKFFGDQDIPLVMLLLLGSVGLVLLIACVNVANLLLARATTREREIAVRTAMGAARTRVLRQLLTESTLLAVAGGIAGVLLAIWGARALSALIPPEMLVGSDITIDMTVLAFTGALVLVTALLFGLAPALQLTRTDVAMLMGGRTNASSRRRGRRRGILVVAEVALATVLLVSAGLMVRSLSSLIGTHAGFEPDNMLTMRVSLDAGYADQERILTYQQRALEQIAALPGVVAAGAVDWLPLSGTNNFGDIISENRREDAYNLGQVFAAPRYFEAMGIRLAHGRTFERRDTRAAEPVAIVSRTAADVLWPGEEPLGKRLRTSWEGGNDTLPPTWRTVIGVVDDVRHAGLNSDPRPDVYIPYAQLPWNLTGMTFVVRTNVPPAAAIPPVREAIAGIDPRQAIYDVRSMEQVVRASGAVVLSRVTAGALTLFGGAALLLAALGLYGVISYSVAQRTFEIGVRTALGATARDVLKLVVRQGMLLVFAGLGIGLLLALSLTRLLRALLYDVSPADPLSFAAMSIILLAVALVATVIPARRAARIDPLSALRWE